MGALTRAALIALGGALGALGRVGVGELVASRFGKAELGTLAANLIGCFLMGAGKAAIAHLGWGSPEVRALVFSGFLGAFTTFSTFEADAFGLWQQGERMLAATYLTGSVVGGVGAFVFGWWLASRGR